MLQTEIPNSFSSKKCLSFEFIFATNYEAKSEVPKLMVSIILTLNMPNCFIDYKKYIHILNPILDLA